MAFHEGAATSKGSISIVSILEMGRIPTEGNKEPIVMGERVVQKLQTVGEMKLLELRLAWACSTQCVSGSPRRLFPCS